MSVNYAQQRRNMVESQLRPNKILDERILTSMETLPRERFVPAANVAMSYSDEDVAVGNGRFALEPMVLGRLVQEARITPQNKVLDIACTTGYSTALLASLTPHVTAIDVDSALLAQATATLQQLGLTARFQAAPLGRGLPEEAPYDVIIVNGAVAAVPETWLAQLAEGGRLLVIIRHSTVAAQLGVAWLYAKLNGHVSARPLFDAQTPYLPDMSPKVSFVF